MLIYHFSLSARLNVLCSLQEQINGLIASHNVLKKQAIAVQMHATAHVCTAIACNFWAYANYASKVWRNMIQMFGLVPRKH